MSSADLSIRLIGRIAAEKTRRGRTPRRGIASANPFSTPWPTSIQEGSAGKLTGSRFMPPVTQLLYGHVPRVVGVKAARTWPKEEKEVGVRLGRPQPTKQSQAESMLDIALQMVGNFETTTGG